MGQRKSVNPRLLFGYNEKRQEISISWRVRKIQVREGQELENKKIRKNSDPPRGRQFSDPTTRRSELRSHNSHPFPIFWDWRISLNSQFPVFSCIFLGWSDWKCGIFDGFWLLTSPHPPCWLQISKKKIPGIGHLAPLVCWKWPIPGIFFFEFPLDCPSSFWISTRFWNFFLWMDTHFTRLSILKKKIKKYRFPLAPL